MSLLSILTGCGLGGSVSQAINPTTGALKVNGGVHGGLQPIVGATIQFYEIGAAGYGSAAKPLLATPAVTNQFGGFSVDPTSYTCDSGAYTYVTASGGNAGAGTNNNIALMALIGGCSQHQNAGVYININEVTTVAAAYALAGFSQGTKFGTPLSSQGGSQATTGTNPTAAVAPADNFAYNTNPISAQGVADAVGVAQILGPYSTGYSPGQNLNGTASVEYWTVNTVANILSACTNTAGQTSTSDNTTACGQLFKYTTPTGGVRPADTIQAALNFALHPGDANLLSGTPAGSNLDGLIVSTPPFQPYVSTAASSTTAPTANTINDWTIAVSYSPVVPTTTTTLLSGPSGVAVDGKGVVWVTNNGAPYGVVALNAVGDPLQAGTGSTQTGAPLYTVDHYIGFASGAATSATIANGAPGFGTSSNVTYGIAIDGSVVNQGTGDAYVADWTNGNVFRIGAVNTAPFGTNGEVTSAYINGANANVAQNSYTLGVNTSGGNSGAQKPTGIAFDSSNSMYVTLYGNGASSPAGPNTGAVTSTCGPGGSAGNNFTSGNKNLIFYPRSGTGYGTLQYGTAGGSGMYAIAMDNSLSNTGNDVGVAGAPFMWYWGEASGSGEAHGTGSGHYSFLFQANTTNGGGSLFPGCNSAVGSITSAGYSGSATTKVTQQVTTTPADTYDLTNNSFQVAFDANSNLWTVNQLPTDSAAASSATYSSFTKFTPTYTQSTPTPVLSASSPFVNYQTGGIANTTAFGPSSGETLVIDGNGNVFAASKTQTSIAAITNNGAALAPATGFSGTIYSPNPGAVAPATVTLQQRLHKAVSSMAIDMSGNLWVPNTTAGQTSVVQIVGVAAPVETPIASAAAAGLLGTKP